MEKGEFDIEFGNREKQLELRIKTS